MKRGDVVLCYNHFQFHLGVVDRVLAGGYYMVEVFEEPWPCLLYPDSQLVRIGIL